MLDNPYPPCTVDSWRPSWTKCGTACQVQLEASSECSFWSSFNGWCSWAITLSEMHLYSSTLTRAHTRHRHTSIHTPTRAIGSIWKGVWLGSKGPQVKQANIFQPSLHASLFFAFRNTTMLWFVLHVRSVLALGRSWFIQSPRGESIDSVISYNLEWFSKINFGSFPGPSAPT